MNKGIVYVDVDGVVARSVEWWLKLYNREWDDHVKYTDITRYTIHEFLKCTREEFERYYLNYNGVLVESGAIDALAEISKTWRVVYATSGHENNRKWLERHGLLVSANDYVRLSDKSLLRGDVLIDDYPKNLEGFKGTKMLFGQPWNSGEWDWGKIKDSLCQGK